MNYLIFNKTCVIETPIDGNNSMVRTGGTSFNESDPLISFINALLHATIKKYGSIVELERTTKIQKLKEDLFKKIKNDEKFKLKLSSFLEIIKENLFNFYKYLNSNDFENFKTESNEKFSSRLLNNGDHEKIKLFKLLSEIITFEDFNKIFKMTEKKWISNDTSCIIDYNKILQKETVRFLMYQEFFEEIDKKKSDFFVKHIILMLNELVKISFEKVSNEKNFLSNFITKDKIDILSNYMDFNIVFLDYQSRQPFFLGSETNLNNNKKTVIVFSFDLKHFEIVGKHLPDDRIQRNFMPYDDTVKNIIYYLSIKSAVNVGSVKTVNDEKENIIKLPQNDEKDSIKDDKKESTIVDNKEKEEGEKEKEKHDVEKQEDVKEENEKEKQDEEKQDEEKHDVEKHDEKEKEEEEEEEEKSSQEINEIEKNIKENIYYNSDDEILKELGDGLN